MDIKPGQQPGTTELVIENLDEIRILHYHTSIIDLGVSKRYGMLFRGIVADGMNSWPVVVEVADDKVSSIGQELMRSSRILRDKPDSHYARKHLKASPHISHTAISKLATTFISKSEDEDQIQ
jgi:hypothetical protein